MGVVEVVEVEVAPLSVLSVATEYIEPVQSTEKQTTAKTVGDDNDKEECQSQDWCCQFCQCHGHAFLVAPLTEICDSW